MSSIQLGSDTLAVTPSSGQLEFNGQYYATDSNASRAQLERLVQGTAVASTSGTSIDFTGIPSWAKRITVMFNGVSTSGTSNYQIQIGSGSITTSGYSGGCLAVQSGAISGTGVADSAAFVVSSSIDANTRVFYGNISIVNVSGNLWVLSGVLVDSSGVRSSNSAGALSLGGLLDRVRFTTTSGTDTFDAGSINIMYEG